MQTTATLSTSVLKKAIDRYYKDLQEFTGKAEHELALRSAFQNLLAYTAWYVNWTLIPEQTIEGGIRPDGILRDIGNMWRGYWEAKGLQSDLDKEIVEKIKNGYPLTNTIFVNTKCAVLYRGKRKIFDCEMGKINDVQEYIVRLVGKVITVSLETVRLVNELAQAVKMEDWLGETMEAN
jgi:hypothetical protein